MKPLVFSMSAISTFMRCKMKYNIMYEHLLDGGQEKEAFVEGTAFHEVMAHRARTGSLPVVDSNMKDVAAEYLHHRDFPENIVLVEEPVYVEFLPNVYVRCTFDLVYREGDYLVIRDWKTFTKMPSLDPDLDFQVLVYVACAMKHFKTTKVKFEHEYVRRTPPGIPKDKAGNCWLPSECYVTQTTMVSLKEAAKIVEEVKWELENILATRESGRYTRTNLKGGGWDSCSSCSVKEICKVMLQNEELSDDMLYSISRKREPIELPEELK